MFLVIVSFETSGTCDGGSDIGAVKTNYRCGHSFQKSCYRSNVVNSHSKSKHHLLNSE